MATGAVNLNVSGVNATRLVLSGNVTLTLSGGYDGQLLLLITQQDSTGSRTLTYTNVPSGTTVDSAANSNTMQLLCYDGATGNWGFLAVATPAGV
jgi:hypothetical protein